MTEGRKDDGGKLRYDLEPQDARVGKIAVLTDGAERYGGRNWEQGMDWGRAYAALQRHLAAWWAGETRDPDSGRPHLDHAACCLDFLSAYEKRGIGTDDRPKKPAAFSRTVKHGGFLRDAINQARAGIPEGIENELKKRVEGSDCEEEFQAEKERDQLAQALTEANRAVEKIAKERDKARAACNQCRLAFEGLVSAQSAIDTLDEIASPITPSTGRGCRHAGDE